MLPYWHCRLSLHLQNGCIMLQRQLASKLIHFWIQIPAFTPENSTKDGLSAWEHDTHIEQDEDPCS